MTARYGSKDYHMANNALWLTIGNGKRATTYGELLQHWAAEPPPKPSIVTPELIRALIRRIE